MPNLDLWPWLEQLAIKTKSAKLQRLLRDEPFAWAQREFVSEVERQYNAGLPVRILVLKGRQLGISTVTEAILFIWCFLYPGASSLVLSKDQESSDYLFTMLKRYWEDGPFTGLFSTKYNRIGYIEWADVGSSVRTDTASKADVGRGTTIQAVHCSEVAFWPMADDIVASLGEAVPYEHGTIIVMESTAQGIGGYFHDEWVKATDPTGTTSTFVPMFFPWWEHEEYSIPGASLAWRDLDDEERDLIITYPKMTLSKLAWRRRKLTTYSQPELFKEEYPNSAEEAFLSTGTNLFDLRKLMGCYEPNVPVEQGFLYNDNGKLAWAEDESGHTFIYVRPDPRRARKYVVAVDPTWTVEGDPACIQVLDRASLEQVAVWHGSADPQTVGQISLALAYFYGQATILNTEVQGGGRKVMEVWRDANYPFIWMDRRPDRPKRMMGSLGWNSTFETKRWMIGTVQGVVKRKHLILHHPATYYEMTRYVTLEDGTLGPSRRSGHDDCVVSLGVAIMTAVTEEQNLDFAAMGAPLPVHVPGERPPQLANVGRTVNPSNLTRFGSMPAYADDPGVDDWY